MIQIGSIKSVHNDLQEFAQDISYVRSIEAVIAANGRNLQTLL